ncbi:cache domain-containing protein [Bradyrhizobium betae]
MSSILTAKVLPQFKLGTKAVLRAVLLIAVNTALVVGAGYWSLTSASMTAHCATSRSLCAPSALALTETVPAAGRHDAGRGAVARAPRSPEDARFRRSRHRRSCRVLCRGNATLFVFDDASGQFCAPLHEREKENGDRVAGTQLAADHPGQAPLRRRWWEKWGAGHAVRRKSFMTAYFPIADGAGKVVGILYVGIPC